MLGARLAVQIPLLLSARGQGRLASDDNRSFSYPKNPGASGYCKQFPTVTVLDNFNTGVFAGMEGFIARDDDPKNPRIVSLVQVTPPYPSCLIPFTRYLDYLLPRVLQRYVRPLIKNSDRLDLESVQALTRTAFCLFQRNAVVDVIDLIPAPYTPYGSNKCDGCTVSC